MRILYGIFFKQKEGISNHIYDEKEKLIIITLRIFCSVNLRLVSIIFVSLTTFRSSFFFFFSIYTSIMIELLLIMLVIGPTVLQPNPSFFFSFLFSLVLSDGNITFHFSIIHISYGFFSRACHLFLSVFFRFTMLVISFSRCFLFYCAQGWIEGSSSQGMTFALLSSMICIANIFNALYPAHFIYYLDMVLELFRRRTLLCNSTSFSPFLVAFSFFLVLALVMAEDNFVHNYLYLHPGENPVAALVPPIIDDTNYHSQSRSMLTTLSTKNKTEFVLGNVRPLDKDKPEHAVCNCENNMVVSRIVHFVSMSIKQSII